MARWLITFETIDPSSTDQRRRIGIPERLFRHLQSRGHKKAIARLLLVKEVVEGGVTQIYSGWSRPDKDDCFVYVGSPTKDYKSLTIETPAPKGMVFLVFVLPDGTIDEWTWRRLAKDGDNDRPSGVTGELIWSLDRN